MKRFWVTCFLSVCLLFFGSTASAQESPETTRLASQLEHVAKRHAAEEVYLQAC